jgi:hypothetical protein
MSSGLVARLSNMVAGKGKPTLFDKAALMGAAVAAAPMTYLTRPVSADELLRQTCTSNRTPNKCANGTCSGGSRCCSDGYSSFCCQLPGGSNYGCPPNSFIAGWWRCTQSITSGTCSTTGKRYYIDCNARPGTSCTCTCPSCTKRRTCCNCFRYGQCNTQISGTTYIVCRLLSCVAPYSGQLGCTNCGNTDLIDNNTCNHINSTVGCLN